MAPKTDWQDCPARIAIGVAVGGHAWHKRTDCYAIRGAVPDAVRGASSGSLVDGGVTISILNGSPPAELDEAIDVLPVYSKSTTSAPAVASGRVYLRLDEGARATESRTGIEDAGFVIESVPGYAPHTAWLVAASGRICDALAGLERLAALPGVAHVEPQLLMVRSFREQRED